MQRLDFLSIFISPLEESKIPYFITGSIASIFYGEPRLTHDIDVVLHLSHSDLSLLATLFPLDQYYCPPEEVLQIEIQRRPYGHFNLIHHASGLKADIYPDAADPLHHWAFRNLKRVPVGEIKINLAPPEYLIIRKLEFYREGGSEKHLLDLRKLLPNVQGSFDSEFLMDQIANRGLANQWHKLSRGD